jgi:hypothetical protein
MFQINQYSYRLTTTKNNYLLLNDEKNLFTNAGVSDNPAVTFRRNRSIEVLLLNADNSSNKNKN